MENRRESREASAENGRGAEGTGRQADTGTRGRGAESQQSRAEMTGDKGTRRTGETEPRVSRDKGTKPGGAQGDLRGLGSDDGEIRESRLRLPIQAAAHEDPGQPGMLEQEQDQLSVPVEADPLRHPGQEVVCVQREEQVVDVPVRHAGEQAAEESPNLQVEPEPIAPPLLIGREPLGSECSVPERLGHRFSSFFLR